MLVGDFLCGLKLMHNRLKLLIFSWRFYLYDPPPEKRLTGLKPGLEIISSVTDLRAELDLRGKAGLDG